MQIEFVYFAVRTESVNIIQDILVFKGWTQTNMTMQFKVHSSKWLRILRLHKICEVLRTKVS
jgi:hypothetical protein